MRTGGSSMTSRTVAQLLSDLGVDRSHSRPRISNDNPFSEAQFKTLKYRPDFPERFTSIQEARAHAKAFFWWYNHEHRHSGVAWHTPHDVHYGQTEAVRAARAHPPPAASPLPHAPLSHLRPQPPVIP